jgi:hypothetical protein
MVSPPTPPVKSEFPKPQVVVRCLGVMPHIRLTSELGAAGRMGEKTELRNLLY